MLLPFCREKMMTQFNFFEHKITKCPLQGSMEGRRVYVVKLTSNRQAAGNSWCVWYPDKHSSIHTQYIYAQYFEALQMYSKGFERNAHWVIFMLQKWHVLITIALELILAGLSGVWTDLKTIWEQLSLTNFLWEDLAFFEKHDAFCNSKWAKLDKRTLMFYKSCHLTQ